jgi:hypothetical protein
MHTLVGMKRFSLSCVAVVASVAALASAGPVAFASAEALPDSSSSGEVASFREGDTAANVAFQARSGISLGSPTADAHYNTASFGFLNDAGAQSAGYRITWDHSPIHPVRPYAEVTWPLLKGQDKVAIGSVTFRLGGDGTLCRVTDKTGKEAGPLKCSMSPRSLDKGWDFSIIDDGLDRIAEASGSITTDASVSLDTSPFTPANGYNSQSVPALGYTTESKLHVNGADVVPVSSSTQFDAVLTAKNVTTEPDTARMKFRYAIRDAKQPADGKSPKYYVRGDVSNYRGNIFVGGSSCEIVDDLDQIVENSGYSCQMDKYYAGSVLTDGRSQYITDFTISKKK